MKAWHVHGGWPSDASLLVFAESKNRARMIGFQHGTWDFDEYIYTHAWRAPAFDTFADRERVIDTNEDLPAGAPAFYSEATNDLATNRNCAARRDRHTGDVRHLAGHEVRSR